MQARIPRLPGPAAGFTLVELMVALTIGLAIVIAMSSVYVSSSDNKRSNARFAEFQSNGRYAMDYLQREIRHAGFIPIGSRDVTVQGTIGTTNYGCGAGVMTDLSNPIWGANDSNPFSGTCIPAANYARGDVLVLRRAGLQSIASATALSATTLYVRTEFVKTTVFLGPTRPTSVQSPVEDYPLHTAVYYVSPWTNAANESPQVPALYRLVLGPGPALTSELIASGIENLQVQYGVLLNGATIFRDANEMSAAEWANVVAVRLWLLARSTDAQPDFRNTSTYTMGDQQVTAADSYQRQVFTMVLQLRR